MYSCKSFVKDFLDLCYDDDDEDENLASRASKFRQFLKNINQLDESKDANVVNSTTLSQDEPVKDDD